MMWYDYVSSDEDIEDLDDDQDLADPDPDLVVTGKGQGQQDFEGSSKGTRSKGKGNEFFRAPTVLMGIGILKAANWHGFVAIERKFLLAIRRILTVEWFEVQTSYVKGGVTELWKGIFKLLELDKKAIWDIVLLANMGICGRTSANAILWDLLREYLLMRKDYEALSAKASSLVNQHRKRFDRPPETHEDNENLMWDWDKLDTPDPDIVAFSPRAVKREGLLEPRYLLGINGEILKPPLCWNFTQKALKALEKKRTAPSVSRTISVSSTAP